MPCFGFCVRARLCLRAFVYARAVCMSVHAEHHNKLSVRSLHFLAV